MIIYICKEEKETPKNQKGYYMFYIKFLLLENTTVMKQWTCTNQYATKEDAMKFAQNVSKGFNGTNLQLYYYIVR